MDCKVDMQTHRASCEMAREENLTRRRRRGSMETERSQELAQGGAGKGRMGHLGMDLCRDHIMGSKNCAKVGLCSCKRQEMGSGRPRGVVHCRQERSPMGKQEGKKKLVRRGLPGSDQVLTQLRARLCTALHGQQESNLLNSNTSLLRVSLDRGLGQSSHTPISIEELCASVCHAPALNAVPAAQGCCAPLFPCSAWHGDGCTLQELSEK